MFITFSDASNNVLFGFHYEVIFRAGARFLHRLLTRHYLREVFSRVSWNQTYDDENGHRMSSEPIKTRKQIYVAGRRQARETWATEWRTFLGAGVGVGGSVGLLRTEWEWPGLFPGPEIFLFLQLNSSQPRSFKGKALGTRLNSSESRYGRKCLRN